MQLSYRKKFIFIHIYKVAGASMEKILAPYCYHPGTLLNLPLIRKLSLHKLKYHRFQMFGSHCGVRELKERLPDVMFKNFFKFAFIRNPWDWQVSIYHYILKWKEHPCHATVRDLGSFDKYIYWLTEQPLDLHGNFALQKDFVCDQEGKVLTDFIGKFENLVVDFAYVLERVRIPPSPLPHVNRTNHKDYRVFYTKETEALVREKFQEDIRMFGYEFSKEQRA